MSPWKVILATMVIFGCGVITGGIFMKTELPAAPATETTPHPAATTSSNQPPPLGQFQRPEFLKRMQKQLDLTAEQNEQITAVMKQSQDRTRLLWDQIFPQLREEMKRDRQEIRKVLDPSQQRKFDELLRTHPRKKEAAAAAAAGRALGNEKAPPGQTNQP